MTFVVRKENIEIVCRIQSGAYAILYLVRTMNDKGALFANWGHYFDWVENTQEQMVLIDKYCPTLYSIMTGGDTDGVQEMDFGLPGESLIHGFGMAVNLPEKTPLLNCLDKQLVANANRMMNKMIRIYSELLDSPCPTEWKTALPEIWG